MTIRALLTGTAVLTVLVAIGLAVHLRWIDLQPLALAVYYLFYPMLALALALSIAWRHVPPGPLRTRVQLAGSVLFFAPIVALLGLWKESILLTLQQEAVAAFCLLAVVAAAGFAGYSILKGQREYRTGGRRSPLLALLIAIIPGIFGVILAKEFVLDIFSPRIAVHGVVERKWVTASPRSAVVNRYVAVSGRTYEATYDVYAGLKTGDAVEGEVGAGSNVILNINVSH